MYKQYYQGFLKLHPDTQHFACHSHHYWPDVTRNAMLQYWDDSAQWVDDKWNYFFGEKLPKLQKFIASTLNTGMPENIVLAPNTHELLFRVISTLDFTQPQCIVTTDSEFHSFNRQADRLSELDNFTVIKVPVQPMQDFQQRFVETVRQYNPSLVFLSHVFFNSGMVLRDLNGLIEEIKDIDGLIVVDGYHGFMALPVDLQSIAERVFYLAGGYKYAQAGEGVCFMHVPKEADFRPVYTGWFAEFGALTGARANTVRYATAGNHYAGATMDLSGMYRLLAVFEWMQEIGLTVDKIHHYVQQLQNHFLKLLYGVAHPYLNAQTLLVDDLNHHGHFFTFKLESAEQTQKMGDYMKSKGVHTDWRGDCLRFGFALYQNAEDFDLSCLGDVND